MYVPYQLEQNILKIIFIKMQVLIVFDKDETYQEFYFTVHPLCGDDGRNLLLLKGGSA